MNINFNNFFLIDDDENINFYNEDLLTDIEEVQNVEAHDNCGLALEFLDSSIKDGTLPGIWLVDINMPIMSGFQFLDKAFLLIQDLVNLPKIYILSSSLHPSDKEEFRKRDFITDFLNKPLLENHLESILN